MRERKYLWVIALLGTVVLLNLPLAASRTVRSWCRDAVAPFQIISARVVERVSGWMVLLLDMPRSLDERSDMITQIAALREQVHEQNAIRRENEDLRRQLEFRKRSARRLIPCQVVARGDVSGWWASVQLDKGTDEGVRESQAVISVDGLVGKTVRVSRHTAEVLLITDPNCEVSCRFSRLQSIGILQGAGATSGKDTRLDMLYAANPCRVEYIPRNREIQFRDEVVTSGLGGIYPEGLVVGHAVRSYPDASGLYQHADVEPAADLLTLRYVFVVSEEVVP